MAWLLYCKSLTSVWYIFPKTNGILAHRGSSGLLLLLSFQISFNPDYEYPDNFLTSNRKKFMPQPWIYVSDNACQRSKYNACKAELCKKKLKRNISVLKQLCHLILSLVVLEPQAVWLHRDWVKTQTSRCYLLKLAVIHFLIRLWD